MRFGVLLILLLVGALFISILATTNVYTGTNTHSSLLPSCGGVGKMISTTTRNTRTVFSSSRTTASTMGIAVIVGDVFGRATAGMSHVCFARPPIVLASALPPSVASLRTRLYNANVSNSILINKSFLHSSLVSLVAFDGKLYRGGSQQRKKSSGTQNDEVDGDVASDGCDTSNIDNNNKKKKNPLSSFLRTQSKISKAVRQGASATFSFVGFVISSTVTLTTDERSFRARFVEPVQALKHYFKTSGVDDELSRSFNRRFGVTLCLLGRVNMYRAAEEEKQAKKKKTKRGFGFAASNLFPWVSSSASSKINSSFLEEARRYMRYTTAVYGQTMINAAEVDVRGRLDGKIGRVTKGSISTHIQVPEEDIVLLDVSTLAGSSHHLRHMVVLDHEHKKVVLSIRGTFSLEEIVVDVTGFSREFCGGEAHSEIANMAERVWAVAGPKIRQVLKQNPGYEFIVTGHSLGAGAACLLRILVENKKLLPRKQPIRCFAFASQPVYTPLEFVPKTVQSTTNFVHENDFIPFLSMEKVRKLLTTLRAVDRYALKHMSRKQKTSLILGVSPPPKELIASVLEAEGKRLVPKKGAPNLYIPAATTVLLKENLDEMGEHSDGSYRCEQMNSREMSQREIRVFPDMLVDHFPSRYEHAFDHLQTHDSEDEDG